MRCAASCSTTSRPRRGLEFVTRKVTDGVARIKLGLATESGSATSTRVATGASPATTSTRCGGCCSRRAGGLRHRHRGDAHRARAVELAFRASAWTTGIRDAGPEVLPAGRSGSARGRSVKAGAARLEAEGDVQQLVEMMVDARPRAARGASMSVGAGHRGRGFVGALVRHLVRAGDEVRWPAASGRRRCRLGSRRAAARWVRVASS